MSIVLAVFAGCSSAASAPPTPPEPKLEPEPKPQPPAFDQVMPETKPLKVTAAQGPYEDLEKFCESNMKAVQGKGEGGFGAGECWRIDADKFGWGSKGPSQITRPKAPFAGAQLIATEDLDFHCHIATKVEDEWFVHMTSEECGSERARSEISWDVDALKFVVPEGGEAALLLVRYHLVVEFDALSYCSEDCETAESSYRRDEYAIVCGRGESGTPACTEPVLIGEMNVDWIASKPAPKHARKPTWKAVIALSPDGLIVSRDPEATGRAAAQKGLNTGHYSFRFP